MFLLAVVAGGQSRIPHSNAAEAESARRIADADLIGKWVGKFDVRAEKSPQEESKPLEMVFSKEGTKWNAVCRFNAAGNDSSDTREVTVAGETVSFRCNIGNSEWVFKGKLAEGKLKGDVEIFEHKERVAKGTWNAARPKK